MKKFRVVIVALILFAAATTSASQNGGTRGITPEDYFAFEFISDPNISPEQDRPPSGLEQFRDEDYRGPLVFRIALDPTLALPRRLDRTPPLFPRARWPSPKSPGGCRASTW